MFAETSIQFQTLFRQRTPWYIHCRGPASLPVEGNSVRSPLRFVALTAALALATSLMPADLLAQSRHGGSRGGAVRTPPSHAGIGRPPIFRPSRWGSSDDRRTLSRHRTVSRLGLPRRLLSAVLLPRLVLRLPAVLLSRLRLLPELSVPGGAPTAGRRSWSPYWGAYGYGYPYYWGGYWGGGYYRSYNPNNALGAARLQVSPRETEVFVDGYYAGVVDDFDGFSSGSASSRASTSDAVPGRAQAVHGEDDVHGRPDLQDPARDGAAHGAASRRRAARATGKAPSPVRTRLRPRGRHGRPGPRGRAMPANVIGCDPGIATWRSCRHRLSIVGAASATRGGRNR